MADHELIRETLVSLGEGMEDCGYDAVLETVEGTGIVGRAVRNPRDQEQLRIIILYLKDLAKTIKAEAPSPERTQAMRLLSEAWESLKAAVYEEEDEAMKQGRKNMPPPEKKRADLLRTVDAVKKPRALPPGQPRPPQARPGQPPQARPAQPRPQKIMVAPVPASPQQKPINGSKGNHYFRG
jgi:hypothetical protein